MFNRILVSVDSSEDSEKAVAASCELAQRFGSAVFVVHARDVQHAPVARGAGLGPRTALLESESEGQQLVDQAVSQLKQGGVDVTGELLPATAPVATQILRAARDRTVGLIVLGSRGMSQLEQLMVGGVAHKIVLTSECPVMLVR